MNLDAYILIGGRSSRLGTDKAFVEVGGETLAERSLNAVRSSKIARKVTFIAGSETQFAIEALTLDEPFIFDLVEGRGPIGGLHAALSYAETPWIFLLACDYPFISPELIALLAGLVSDEYGAVVPEQPDGRLQPLCAFYNVNSVRSVVEEIIMAPRVPPSMRSIVRSLSPRIVQPSEYGQLAGSDRFFVNVNTPADLSEVLANAAERDQI